MIVLWVALIVPLVPAARAEFQAQAGVGRVRFVHIATDVPTLDAMVDGTLWARVDPHEAVSYQDVLPGEHTFSFRLLDATQDLMSVVATVDADQRITVVAMDGPELPVARVYTDDVSAPARNAARITVVHAVPDAGPMALKIDGTTVADALPYGAASAGSQFYDGTHDIALVVGELAQPLSGAVRTFTGDRAYTLFVVGSAAAGEFQIVAAESSVLKPAANSQFRFAHMARDVGDVAVYVNHADVPLFPRVKFGGVTQYYVTGQGPHTVEIYPAGSARIGAPLARGTADVGPNRHVLFVAQGAGSDLTVAAYSGDFSPLAAGSARLQVVNAADGNPAFRVETMGEMSLFDSLAVGETASRIVPAGSYGIRFSDAATGAMMMEQSGIRVLPGTVTFLIAFDDDPAVPLINAVPVSAERAPQYAAIRWAHLDSSSGPVDVYLGSTPVVRGLGYQMMIDYRLYKPADYAFKVYPAGADPATTPPLIEERLDMRRMDRPRTIYFYGTATGVDYEVVLDNVGFLPGGKGRVRFLNAALNTGSVYVTVAATNTVLIDNLVARSPSVHKDLLVGVRDFAFIQAGGGVIAMLEQLEIEAGVIYTVVLCGDAAQSGGVDTLVWETVP